MVTNKKVIEAAQTIIDYCKEQQSCQNCIFRAFGADSWECHIGAFDLAGVYRNIEAKKKNHGWL